MKKTDIGYPLWKGNELFDKLFPSPTIKMQRALDAKHGAIIEMTVTMHGTATYYLSEEDAREFLYRVVLHNSKEAVCAN